MRSGKRQNPEILPPGKKAWLIGNKGMLGTELSLCFEARGLAYVGTDREVDITDAAALEAFAAKHSIAVIVNCAAYTAVDRAEDDADLCRRLNIDGHYTNEGNITWFDFAREIYEQGRRLGLLTGECAVKPCTSAEFPARVKRPAYSVLDKTKIYMALNLDIPAWDESLIKYLRLLAKEQGLQEDRPAANIRRKRK